MIDGSPSVLEDTFHQVLDFGPNETFLVIHMSMCDGYHHLQHGMFGWVFGLIVYGFTRDASYGYSMVRYGVCVTFFVSVYIHMYSDLSHVLSHLC